MRNREQENQGDWAQEVPQRRFRGPYSDYGWERGQSVLPEFRGPDVHLTPEESAQVENWRRWDNMPGPYRGRGPRGYTRSDERIYEEVCERMTLHGQLDASNIQVQVNNGEVTLTGEVPNRGSKRLAEDISDSVAGVQDVQNRLQIRQKNSTPDR